MAELLAAAEDFTFRRDTAVTGISGTLAVYRGEKLLLAGPSGCGKSTLLLALKGLAPGEVPGTATGRILYRGADMTGVPNVRVGLLLQNPDAQMVCRTVRDEIAFGLENQSLSRNEISRRIDRYAAEYRITGLMERVVSTLSGGEKQKVALVSILAMEPELLLLDEPFGYLDREASVELAMLLAAQHERSAIIAEHNPALLARVCTRAVSIDGGTVRQRSLEELVSAEAVPRIAPVAAGNDVLTVDALRFARGRRIILEDISLRLREGEVLGITGANGAGKSTLLALCAGLLKPCGGHVLLDGKPVRSLSPRRRFARLGMLLQNPEHHFTALRVDREAPRDALERFGLVHKAEGPPFALSEGEKRRLTLAAAFARGNTVFLLDEPTFSLDAPSRRALAVLIGELRRSGCSFLIVSHDHEFLNAVADRQVLLAHGRLSSTTDTGEIR